jgi:hypothetical protein
MIASRGDRVILVGQFGRFGRVKFGDEKTIDRVDADGTLRFSDGSSLDETDGYTFGATHWPQITGIERMDGAKA